MFAGASGVRLVSDLYGYWMRDVCRLVFLKDATQNLAKQDADTYIILCIYVCVVCVC